MRNRNPKPSTATVRRMNTLVRIIPVRWKRPFAVVRHVATNEVLKVMRRRPHPPVRTGDYGVTVEA